MASPNPRLNLHEDLSRDQRVEGSSNRSFGLVFACALTMLALSPLRHHQPLRWWAVGGAGAFLLLALAIPRALGPLNAVWLRLGLLMGRMVTPITLGVMFYLVFTPLGLLMRVLGKDVLGLRPQPGAASHWVPRMGGEASKGMSRQF